jgi:RecB family exonuclease
MVSKEESKSLDKLFDLDKKVFSPSSLLLFEDCQKKFEYKYVYNMPEDKMVSWEAVQLGSFVHHVLEKGVKGKFSKVEEFLLFANELHLIPEWEGIDIEAARQMIEVFYERNKDKFSEESKTEQLLEMELGGIKFKGFADRIDFSSEGVGIIDYKTGKSQVMPKHRNWQLGFYALAASKFGKVKRVTLDMLRQEKPLSFIVDEQGNAVEEVEGRMKFNIYKVEEELVRTAGEILGAYREGFKACNIESGCEFCGEYVYGN